jgi:hypothetical protein
MLPVINSRISDVITSVKYIMSEMLPVINLRIFEMIYCLNIRISEMIYCLNIRISEMIPRLKRNQEKARFTCIAFPVLLI